MERELAKEVCKLREENQKLWELVESLKNTNNRLVDTYLLGSAKSGKK